MKKATVEFDMEVSKPKSLGLRFAAYLCSALALLNPVAPALANILEDVTIEQDLNENPLYLKATGGDYQFNAPQFIEWPSSGTKSLESVYQELLREHSSAISPPTYVPIGVGGITTFIPTYTRYKYVGTPAVQARYVRTQIVSLLGRNIFKYASEAEQLNALYSNAVSYAKEHGVRYGVPLFLDQNSSGLERDMIWPELREINGQAVIVPVVYLTASTVSEYKVVDTNQQIPKATRFGSLTVYNSDLKAERDTFLEVAGNLNVLNGSITGDGALKILAVGKFDNASSIVSASGDLEIGAKSIDNRTIVYRYDLGHEQGTRYGEIASIASTNGDVILKSHSDIQFNGADASAQNGSLTLAANGHIKIGTQQLYSGSTSRYGNGTQTRSQVSYLQSHLTAEETIKLVASGQIVIDAAEIVSDSGHIELLAGMGISVIDAMGVTQSQASGKFGKKKVDESIYQTVAIRTLLDAGKGIKLNTDFGDITLRAADITSGEGAQVSAKNGAVNLLMTTETDHYSYSSVKKGTFTTKTVSKGRNIETGVPNSIVGGFAVEALNGITVEYEGDPNLSLNDQLDKIAEMEGMRWIDNVRNSPDVDWNSIVMAHEEWYEKNTSLSPAFAAVVAIAVAIATSGAGTAFAGALGAAQGGTMAAAISAGTSAFISQATLAVANGAVNGDIKGALDDFASEDTLKSLAVAMVTAGAIAEVDAAFFNVDKAGVTQASSAGGATQAGVDSAINTTKAAAGGMALTAQVGQAVTHAAIRAGIQSTVFDGVDFSDAFRQSLMQNATSALGRHAAEKIGAAFDGPDATGVDTALKYISHAAVGCIIGVATAGVEPSGDAESNCYSQGGGAVIGEFVASSYRESNSARMRESQEKLEGYLDNKIERIEELLVSGYSEAEIKEIISRESGQLIRDVRVLAERGVDLAKLSAAIGAFAAGADAAGVNAAATGAENAARYNALSDYFSSMYEAIEEVRTLLSNPVGPLELLADKLADSVINAGVELAKADPVLLAQALEGALGIASIDANALVEAGIDISNPAISAGLIAAVIDTVGVGAILGDAYLRDTFAPFLGTDLNKATIERAEQAVHSTVELVRNIDQVLPAMKEMMDQAVIDNDPYAKAQVARLVGGITIGMAVGKISIVAAPETLGVSLVTLGAASALRLQKTLALIKKLSVEGKINLDKVVNKLPFDVTFKLKQDGTEYDVEIGERHADTADAGDSLDLVPYAPSSIPVLSVEQSLGKVDNLRRALDVSKSRNIAFAEFDIEGTVGELVGVSGAAKRAGTVDVPQNPRFVTIATGNNPRTLDSEVKILEALAESLEPNARGVVNLFSERPLCVSCSNVVPQFRAAFPNIIVNVSSGPAK